MSLSPKAGRGPAVRSIAAVAALIGIAAVAAGCAADVVDPAKTEIAVRFDVQEATDTEIAGVTCPSDVEVITGARFTCTVTARSGVEAVAEIEILNDDADLRVVKLTKP
jgi:hypothetical protein